MSLGEREQTAWLSGTMARELDMDPDSLRFDYSEDSLSPAYNVTAAQSKELATLLTLAERLRVHVSAITPDASALQRFLPFLPSHQQCLAWRDNEQWLWATRYRWGRKLAVGMTSAKELAAALSVDPESVAICGEGGFDPWEAVSVRQPPLPPPGGDFAIALGWRWEGVLMNPPINFLPWRQQRRTAFLRFWLLMFVAPLLLAVGITLILRLTSSAEARVDAVLLQGEQQLARSLQITKPRLLERQQIREQRLQRQRQRQFTRDWQSAAGSTGGAFTRARLADNDKLAAGNAGDQGAYNKHYRVKRTRNVTPPGCIFSSQSAGATQQDAQGRWQFEYQLTRKVSDEHVL
ncbi:pilus assembly protein [Escherichia coli]|nr:pilus assembly protein [Escherichia coli]